MPGRSRTGEGLAYTQIGHSRGAYQRSLVAEHSRHYRELIIPPIFLLKQRAFQRVPVEVVGQGYAASYDDPLKVEQVAGLSNKRAQVSAFKFEGVQRGPGRRLWRVRRCMRR